MPVGLDGPWIDHLALKGATFSLTGALHYCKIFGHWAGYAFGPYQFQEVSILFLNGCGSDASMPKLNGVGNGKELKSVLGWLETCSFFGSKFESL